MFLLEGFVTFFIIVFFLVVLYLIAGDTDKKSYHVLDDCTILVLNRDENVNDGNCVHCYFKPGNGKCPVDEEGNLKCYKKDMEVGNYSNHIWEVANG